MATTGCPTFSEAESPIVAGVSPLAPWAWTTARSVTGSRPTIVASYVVPVEVTTEIEPPSAAAATTWLLVSTLPSAESTMPLPSSDSWPPETLIRTTLGVTAEATASVSVVELLDAGWTIVRVAAAEAEVDVVPSRAMAAVAAAPPPTRPMTRATAATRVTRRGRREERRSWWVVSFTSSNLCLVPESSVRVG